VVAGTVEVVGDIVVEVESCDTALSPEPIATLSLSDDNAVNAERDASAPAPAAGEFVVAAEVREA
jgi:hypothetical protein